MIAVYEGEPDRKCKASGRRTNGMASGSISGTPQGSYVECPECRTGIQHRSGWGASRIPPHNVPRILTKRPKWAEEQS